jgi:hypothetical protein
MSFRTAIEIGPLLVAAHYGLGQTRMSFALGSAYFRTNDLANA